jgi:hypothetical protein
VHLKLKLAEFTRALDMDFKISEVDFLNNGGTGWQSSLAAYPYELVALKCVLRREATPIYGEEQLLAYIKERDLEIRRTCSDKKEIEKEIEYD